MSVIAKLFRAAALGLTFSLSLAGIAHAATAFDFTFFGIDGNPIPLAQYKGKALLIVNTATQCDFTPQLKGLEILAESYRERGLVVIGVSSNSFGQEPGNASQIKAVTEGTYDITFPMTETVDVTGPKAVPFYRWAVQQLGPLAEPKWNFTKYLVAPDGHLTAWFETQTEPQDPRLLRALEKILPVPAGIAARTP